MRGRRPRQRDHPGAALTRGLFTRLLLAAVALLLVADFAGGQDWAGRVALGVLAAVVILRLGVASMRPLWAHEKSGPPVDVVDPEGGIPVYACTGCGTQLVLLRKGNDRPPRHCGEPMRYEVVRAADAQDRPDTLAYDDETAAAAVPDYPPDDL